MGYETAVASKRRFWVPTPSDDDPGPLALGLIATGCLIAGLATAAIASSSSTHRDKTRAPAAAKPHDLQVPSAPRLAPAEPEPQPATDRAEPRDADPVTVERHDQITEPPGVPEPNPLAKSEPATAAARTESAVVDRAADGAGASRAARTFNQGHVAYLRCEGVPRGSGRFPCPRDRDLEASVWRTLATLQTCNVDPGRGVADVRLQFEGKRHPKVRLRHRSNGGLRDRAVLKCVAEELSQLSTRHDPTDMIVSFRFELR